MHIKSIVAGAAIALAATIGSASAADLFVTLDEVTAQPLTALQAEQVRGAVFTVTFPVNGLNAIGKAAIDIIAAVHAPDLSLPPS